MNPQATREALLKIAAGVTELALSLGTEQPGTGGGAPRAAVSPAPERSPFEDEAPDLGPVSNRTPPSRESGYTECPAHRKTWTDGNFGPYCTAPSEDPSPEWTNAKGYCRVTPKNAAAWERKHPRGQAA